MDIVKQPAIQDTTPSFFLLYTFVNNVIILADNVQIIATFNVPNAIQHLITNFCKK